MYDHPVTIVLIITLCSIAYYIWAYSVEPSLLTFSYAALMEAKEYWRIITASFTHFELLHLGFNALGLYQFLQMEDVYNSVKYAYLSFDAVVITMLICLGIHHLLITYFHKVELISQQAVGYSCVLFAWMVAASVRMSQFCPLASFFPNFCFSTYVIFGFPLNIGPILLLFLTKFIIPRSSLTGHFSGILIGVPLSWNLLDWLTPLQSLPLCVVSIVLFRQLFFWRFPSHSDLTTSISDCTSPYETKVYRSFLGLTVILWIVSIVIIVSNPWIQLFPRLVVLAVTYACARTRRCLFITDNATAHQKGIELMLISLFFILCFLFFDSWSLFASLMSYTYLTSFMADNLYIFGVCSYALAVIIELSYITSFVLTLQSNRVAGHVLILLRLDWSTLLKDMVRLGCIRDTPTGLQPGQAFTGRANILSANHSEKKNGAVSFSPMHFQTAASHTTSQMTYRSLPLGDVENDSNTANLTATDVASV